MFLQEFFPDNFFPVGFFVKLGADADITTSGRRTLTVRSVDRLCNVPSVSRECIVPARSRTNVIS